MSRTTNGYVVGFTLICLGLALILIAIDPQLALAVKAGLGWY